MIKIKAKILLISGVMEANCVKILHIYILYSNINIASISCFLMGFGKSADFRSQDSENLWPAPVLKNTQAVTEDYCSN